MIRRPGLTLMEVVVAMVIVSVLMASLYAAFRTAWVAERSGREAVQRAQAVGEAMRQLRDDLLGAVEPSGAIGGSWAAELDGDGGVRELTFRTNTAVSRIDYTGLTSGDLAGGTTARWPVQPIGGDVQEVAWFVRPDPQQSDRFILTRGTTRNLLAVDPVTYDEHVILRDVRRLTLRYYDGQDWLEEWDSDLEGNELPAAVEIVIERSGRGPDATSRRLATVVRLPLSTIAADAGGARE